MEPHSYNMNHTLETPVERAGYPLTTPRVAAAIVTYNKRDDVLKLLARLRDLRVPAFITVNACTDGTAAAIRTQFPDVSLLDSEHNLGGTGGFNCAVLAALSSGASYVVLIDDDAIPATDCLNKLADFLDQHTDYAMAAPAVYLSTQPDTLQETGGDVVFSREVPVEAWNRFRSNIDLPDHFDIGYASACLLMVRADIIREYGVMDWDYYIFSDDVDWCLRIQRAGFRLACVSAARAYHDFPWAKSFSPMRLYYFHRNGFHFIARWHTGDPFFVSVRLPLLRLFRSWIQARLVGDHEIANTLKQAFRDAWSGRYGRWKEPVQFPTERALFFEAYPDKQEIKEVLLNIRIEEFYEPVLKVLRQHLDDGVNIHLLCDAHRVEEHAKRPDVVKVLPRATGRLRQFAQFFKLRQQSYDLVITDAFMEPRSSHDMTGRRSAIFHEGELWTGTHRPVRSLLATLGSHTAAAFLAWLLWPRFIWPKPLGRPPREAAPILEKLGIRPAVGHPWARKETVPFSAAPDLSPLFGSRWLREARQILQRILLPTTFLRRNTNKPITPSPLGPGKDSGGYTQWCDARESWAPRHYSVSATTKRPLFSIIVPVYDPRPNWLTDCIRSVCDQTYARWELILVDDASSRASVRRELEDLCLRDSRIHIIFRQDNGGISVATNTGAATATGDYIFFLDQDDVLDPHALAAFAKVLEEEETDTPVGIIYADEDRFNETRERFWPGFKPAYSPDKLLATNYMHHPVAIRRELFDALNGLRPTFDGSQDHDLLLRAVEAGEAVRHIPDVLYHMRVHEGSLASGPAAKPEALIRDLQVIQDALERRGIAGDVAPIPSTPGFHIIHRQHGTPETISILTAPDPSLCQPQPEANEAWPNGEYLTATGRGTLPSQLNALAEQAGGDILIITATGIQPCTDWQKHLLPNVTRPDIGLVTGRLVYQDNKLHACGLVVGIAGATGRWHYGCHTDDQGFGGWMLLQHEVSAAPWQWLAVRRDLFIEAGGFCEDYRFRGFDTDLALRLSSQFALRHLAVPSFQAHVPAPWPGWQMEEWDNGDLTRLWERWGKLIQEGDPYFNPNFSRYNEGIDLLDPDEANRRTQGAFSAYDRLSTKLLQERFCIRKTGDEHSD